MLIQFNTDNHLSESEKSRTFFTNLISEELEKYGAHINRIEVHLTDENGDKEGGNDKRCLLEVRMTGHTPIAVTNIADSEALAIDGAIEKIKHVLETVIGKSRNH